MSSLYVTYRPPRESSTDRSNNSSLECGFFFSSQHSGGDGKYSFKEKLHPKLCQGEMEEAAM